MIGCDNELCKIEWFHTDCLRIEKIPKGKWFCPECTKGKRAKKKETDIIIIVYAIVLYLYYSLIPFCYSVIIETCACALAIL